MEQLITGICMTKHVLFSLVFDLKHQNKLGTLSYDVVKIYFTYIAHILHTIGYDTIKHEFTFLFLRIYPFSLLYFLGSSNVFVTSWRSSKLHLTEKIPVHKNI